MVTRKILNRCSTFEVVEARCLMSADLQAATDSSGSDNGTVASIASHQISMNVSANSVATAVYLRVSPRNQSSDLNLDGVINHRDVHSLISTLKARTSQSTQRNASAGEGENASAPSEKDLVAELARVPALSGSDSGSDPGLVAVAKYDVNSDGQVSPADLLWIVKQIKEYDPLTPCECAACAQTTVEGRCENASIAATQSASLLTEITGMPEVTVAPEGERDAFHLLSQQTSQPIEDFLRSKQA